MNYSTSEENYLKAVYHLQEEGGSATTSAVADKLNTKAASVTDMMKKLSAKGLLNYTPYYGFSLSAEGRKTALFVIRRHRLWEFFLSQKLGFSWEEVHQLADELEHVSSKKLIDRLDAYLGFPPFDPHGDPIPDSKGKIAVRHHLPLSLLPPNKGAEVCQVTNQSAEMLELLKHKAIGIGTKVEVKKHFPFDQTLEIKIKSRTVTISEQLAKTFLYRMNRVTGQASLSEVHQSVDTTNPAKPAWKRVLSYFGPAYLVSVGYMDPGNWATDLQGGSQFGYKLIWVLLMSNLMALLLQSLSARLGIVRGRDLAQANRETYPKTINFFLYILAEIAIAATDLAEVLGMAIGIQLLTGMPLLWGVLITVLDTFLLLLLQRLGMRKMEAFIICLIAIIGLSFLIEIILAKPKLGEVITGFVPSLPNTQALFIATGIIGATIMPHNLYLHSALVQTRKIQRDAEGIRRALKLNFIDSTIALNAAFFVNAAILVLAASVFHQAGRADVAEIKQAHNLLNDFLGTSLAPILFAVALIAAGQSSTITGTLAGQIVMEGYLRIRINPWVRRLLTRVIAIIPAVIVILINGEENIDDLLVLSQVVLSLQLGFAVIPLIHFVSERKTMGDYTIKPLVQVIAWCVTAILVYLNLRMLYEKAADYFLTGNNMTWKVVIIVSGLLFVGLLLTAVLYPLLRRKPSGLSSQLHRDSEEALELGPLPRYQKVAVALDFSERDQKVLAHAVAQSAEGATVVLIHVVESVSAKILGENSDDFETQKDKEKLDVYAARLRKLNLNAETHLGFRYRTKEIARLVNQSGAGLLIIGAHGHKGMKDWLYGETIEAVRHQLKIPVLIV